jgi:hypothetical protein
MDTENSSASDPGGAGLLVRAYYAGGRVAVVYYVLTRNLGKKYFYG